MRSRAGQTAPPYTEAQATRCLAWLARGMQQHGQTVFLIEQLQPSWLPAGEYGIYEIRVILHGIAVMVMLGMILFGLIHGLEAGAVIGMFMLLVFLVVLAFKDKSHVQTVETLSWSWARALKGFAGGLSVGLSIGLLSSWFYNDLSIGEAFIIGLLFGIAGTAFRGFRPGIVERKTVPNQGVKRSLYNAVKGGAFVGLIVGLIGGRLAVMSWENVGAEWLEFGLSFGLFFGLIGGFFYGGYEVVKHYTLRYMLYRRGELPWRLAAFLDYAAEDLAFLQKVGGGYMFIHRYLLEHFAALEDDGAEKSATVVSAERSFLSS